jgi:hypothetical protein
MENPTFIERSVAEVQSYFIESIRFDRRCRLLDAQNHALVFLGDVSI